MVLAKTNIEAVQDVPPPGGYPKINTVRGARARGPPGWAIWAFMIGCTAYGFSKIGETNKEGRLWTKEKRETRMALAPFIQVEMDRKMKAKMDSELALETEIMKNRKDWVVGKPQYSKRWTYPYVFIKDISDDEIW